MHKTKSRGNTGKKPVRAAGKKPKRNAGKKLALLAAAVAVVAAALMLACGPNCCLDYSSSLTGAAGVYEYFYNGTPGGLLAEQGPDGQISGALPVCGNGAIEGGEACDDWNTDDCDGCKGDCSRSDKICGDGITECGEECDDWNTNNSDGCNSICYLESCPAGLSGNGTAGNPCMVANCTQLQAIEERMGLSYALNGSINCSNTTAWDGAAGFDPIGSDSNPFRGELDGRNNTILGLYIYRPSDSYVGLFGCSGSLSCTAGLNCGDIWDIGLSGANITGNSYVAGLLGSGWKTQISSSYVTGRINGTLTTTGGVAGALLLGGSITNSYSAADVSSGSWTAGGLIGYLTGAVADCYSVGDVISPGTNYVGGIAGESAGGSSITNSFASGNISGASAAGGLVGLNNGTMTDSYYNNRTSSSVACAGSGSSAGCTAIQDNESYFYDADNPPMNKTAGGAWQFPPWDDAYDDCDFAPLEWEDACSDTDEDGYGTVFSGCCRGPVDCDDSNPSINPGNREVCATSADDNCNGQANEGCEEDCSEVWSCGPWGSCLGGRQARSCSCGCPRDVDCTGDNTKSRSCDCNSAADCPREACKAASCADNTCQYTNAAGSCDDNNACTKNDICSGGSCSGTATACGDSNACTTDSCNPSTGCVFTPNTASCGDSNACTISDTCSGGSCSGTPRNCSDGIACTIDSCVGGSCAHDALSCGCASGSDCPQITCKSALCASGNCSYSDVKGPCDDSNACTKNDTCSAGSCAGAAIACDDSNACTDDSCDAALGCVLTPNTASCDDSNACTESDYCMNGACVSGEYTCPCRKGSDCDDNNPCTNEACSNGSCVYSNAEGGCDDGRGCTRNDYCERGVCVPGEGTCGAAEAECDKSWQCGLWSACANGRQARSCACDCPDSACSGDHYTEQSCASKPHSIRVSAGQGLSVGDVLIVRITDEDGTQTAGRIDLIRPDGTSVAIQGDSYVVDQAGVWKIVVEKEGYPMAEAETSVIGKAAPAADMGSQMSNAVQEAVEFMTKEPARFALLLMTIALAVGSFFVLRARRKSAVEKL